MRRPESRKARLLSSLDAAEEGLKGFVEPPKSILQNVGMSADQIRARLFESGKLVLLLVVADALTV